MRGGRAGRGRVERNETPLPPFGLGEKKKNVKGLEGKKGEPGRRESKTWIFVL